MMRLLGPRHLDDDLPEPEWLRNDEEATKALRKLAERCSQNRLLSALELLRAEVLTRAKADTATGHPLPYFPSLDDVDSAVAAFETAARKLERVLEPFAFVPVVIDYCLDPEAEERDVLPLSEVRETLHWMQGGMIHLRSLIRMDDGLRDLLKAYITVHAHDFERERGGYYDRLVAELINAATTEARKTPYDAVLHKDWRSRHKDLLDRVARVVLSELKEGGYDIAVDDDGNVTKCQPPTKPPTVQAP